jgi:hypothetical protein
MLYDGRSTKLGAPVLYKQFYDRFGEAVTNELVDWFNQVDAAHKSDIREMNELNYARFEAKLERRLAELRGELRTDIEKGLSDQTRFFFLAWAVLLASRSVPRKQLHGVGRIPDVKRSRRSY